MPRIARVILPNYPHHITQRGTNKTRIFADDEDREKFLQYLKDWVDKTNTKVLAYCLMSNHFHLLLVPEKEDSLGRCLHGITFRYAQYFNLKYDRNGRLWQNRYFSCPIDREEYLWNAVKYVEENPVRKGLAQKVEDWKWSSARANTKDTKDNILSLPGWLGKKEREKYGKSIEDKGKEDEIRRTTSTGRPLGNMNFYYRIQKTLNRNLLPKKGGRPKKSKEKEET